MICSIGNAKQFPSTVLKCISGALPKSINGMYFRNGPGTVNYDNQIINHWFSGDGCIFKLEFDDGECKAQMKFVDTPIRKQRDSARAFQPWFFQKLWMRWNSGKQYSNTANTSVLCLKDSPDLLALCEGGQPYILKKKDLKSEGFSNYGWITSAFSAHPKVDPDNGDIFNIGMDLPNIRIMRATKDMKKICENSLKLRQMQSIHDCCLAGDYLLVFEAPVRFHLKELLWNKKFFYDCLSFDESLPTLVHIFSKQKLQLIKTIQFDPFYSFHFTNGYSDKQKIVAQYIRYDSDSVRQLFKLVSNAPKYCKPEFKQSYKGVSTLEQLTINLTDFTTKKRSVKINGEFPVCEDHEVGKQWRYTYAVGSEVDEILKLNTIYKYDRVKEKLDRIKIQGNVHINQPALIRTQDNLYIMCVINRDRKSYVQIFNAQSMQNICQLQIPQFIPAGFHGKWQSTLK